MKKYLSYRMHTLTHIQQLWCRQHQPDFCHMLTRCCSYLKGLLSLYKLLQCLLGRVTSIGVMLEGSSTICCLDFCSAGIIGNAQYVIMRPGKALWHAACSSSCQRSGKDIADSEAQSLLEALFSLSFFFNQGRSSSSCCLGDGKVFSNSGRFWRDHMCTCITIWAGCKGVLCVCQHQAQLVVAQATCSATAHARIPAPTNSLILLERLGGGPVDSFGRPSGKRLRLLPEGMFDVST